MQTLKISLFPENFGTPVFLATFGHLKVLKISHFQRTQSFANSCTVFWAWAKIAFQGLLCINSNYFCKWLIWQKVGERKQGETSCVIVYSWAGTGPGRFEKAGRINTDQRYFLPHGVFLLPFLLLSSLLFFLIFSSFLPPSFSPFFLPCLFLPFSCFSPFFLSRKEKQGTGPQARPLCSRQQRLDQKQSWEHSLATLGRSKARVSLRYSKDSGASCNPLGGYIRRRQGLWIYFVLVRGFS